MVRRVRRVALGREALGLRRVNLPDFVRYTFTLAVRRFRFTGVEVELARLRR